MLDLSRLETGKMQLKLVNGDVINYLRYVVEAFHSLTENHRQQLHYLTDMDTMFVACDPEKLRQIQYPQDGRHRHRAGVDKGAG